MPAALELAVADALEKASLKLPPTVTPTETVSLPASAFDMASDFWLSKGSIPTVIAPVLFTQSSPDPPLIPATLTEAVEDVSDDDSPRPAPRETLTSTVVLSALASAIAPVPSGSPPNW
jgi:hypothetical protein